MLPDCCNREMNLQLNEKSYALTKYKRKLAQLGLYICKINRRIQDVMVFVGSHASSSVRMCIIILGVTFKI